MPVHLLPCPGCSRHVRAGERECPFCLASLAELSRAPAPRAPTARLGRAATFAFGAAVATSVQVAGCSDGESGAVDSGVAVDAASAIDAGGELDDAGSISDAGETADAASSDDAGPSEVDAGPMEDDAGGVAPLYGAVPAPDASVRPQDAGGGPAPLYGAPPTPA